MQPGLDMNVEFEGGAEPVPPAEPRLRKAGGPRTSEAGSCFPALKPCEHACAQNPARVQMELPLAEIPILHLRRGVPSHRTPLGVGEHVPLARSLPAGYSKLSSAPRRRTPESLCRANRSIRSSSTTSAPSHDPRTSVRLMMQSKCVCTIVVIVALGAMHASGNSTSISLGR